MKLTKLSDKQRKKILAEYIEGGTSYRKLAAKYGVTDYTISRIVRSDKTLSQKIAQKKEENTVSVLAFMESEKNSVCELIGKLLEEMKNPAKIQATPLNQLATTFGIVIDKYTALELKLPDLSVPNNLFEAIDGCAKAEENIDDLPELQQAAETDADMVETSEIQK